MPTDYDLTEGDVGTIIDMTCRDTEGLVIDISTATLIRYRWKQEGKALAFKVASVQDGPNGVARYTTQAGDILQGDLKVQVELTVSGNTWTSDIIEKTVGSLLT